MNETALHYTDGKTIKKWPLKFISNIQCKDEIFLLKMESVQGVVSINFGHQHLWSSVMQKEEGFSCVGRRSMAGCMCQSLIATLGSLCQL